MVSCGIFELDFTKVLKETVRTEPESLGLEQKCLYGRIINHKRQKRRSRPNIAPFIKPGTRSGQSTHPVPYRATRHRSVTDRTIYRTLGKRCRKSLSKLDLAKWWRLRVNHRSARR